MKEPVIALIGNPNCGKSTLFNALTGSHQHVGNWPGVTVDCKQGFLTVEHQRFQVVDLPGMYSLSSTHQQQAQDQALDKQIASDYILTQQVDVIVNVVDASHLERHLYLTSELMELGRPIILALNMMDNAKRSGHEINFKLLHRELNVTVIPIIANKKQGLDALKLAIQRQSEQRSLPKMFSYPQVVEQSIKILMENGLGRFSAIRFLGDESSDEIIRHCEITNKKLAPTTVQTLCEQGEAMTHLSSLGASLREKIKRAYFEDPDIVIADARYQYIHAIIQKTLQFVSNQSTGWSTRLDAIVLNRWLGVPIFLFVMYALFFFAINIGGVFQDFFDITTQALFVDGLAQGLSYLGVPPWINAILTHGLGKGINTTLTFIPVLASLYFFLALLEASGYMARAAFVIDRVMRALGLPGQSFIPLIVGFGCNVPGIMATRHMDNHRDRVLTILMSPFMSCSARLAIFAIFTTAFFPVGGYNIIFLLYVVGIFMAILTGFILRRTLLSGQAAPLLLELPNYHLPDLQTLLMNTWTRLKLFIFRAGKVIVPVCMVIGLLNSISTHGFLLTEGASSQSLLSMMGRILTPLFSPIGIHSENWPATVGLLTGSLAKEVVIGTLNTLYSQVGHLKFTATNFDLWNNLKAAFISIPNNLRDLTHAFSNPLAATLPDQSINHGVYGLMMKRFGGSVGAFSYLLFVLLYIPCVSTVAAIRRELNQAWMWFSVGWSLLLAYGTALIFYQVATFWQHPLSSLFYLTIWLLVSGIVIVIMRNAAHRNKFKPGYVSQGAAAC